MTISATGKEPKSLRSRAAFTIMEVLLVLMLIMLVAGVFAINFDVLLRGFDEKEPVKVMHEVVRDARYYASLVGARVILRYDVDKQAFIIEKKNNPEEPLKEYKTPVPYVVSFRPKEPKIRRRGRDVTISRGYKEVGDTIEFVPDGVSTSVRIRLLVEGEGIDLDLDPFSSGLSAVEERQAF